MLRIAALALLLASGASEAGPVRPRTLTHPAAESQGDPRGAYPRVVLQAALERAGSDVELQPYPIRATQERVLRLIESGALDVGWSMASAERESRLGMVPFPVDRGLLGWRQMLAKRSDLPRFVPVDGLEALARLRVAQGHDWPDRTILAANGLPTTGAVGYESLFAMLGRGRVDYLARAASEAERERLQRPELDLAIVPDVVLHYRTALVFYVRKDDRGLRDDISRGLRSMLDDGSLDRLFLEAYGSDVAALSSPSMRRIELRNPIAARGLDAAPAQAWWSP